MSDTELLTYEEVAARLGRTLGTTYSYVSSGRLAVAGRAKNGKRLFHPSDVDTLADALANPVNLYQEKRRQRRDAILAAGARACTKCGVIKPLEDFAPSPAGVGGRHSRCRACSAALSRVYAQIHRAERRAYKKEYWQKNQDKIQAYRLTMRAYFRTRYHALRAVDDGKRSPICRKHGFSLVRGKCDAYRPVRADQVLSPGEVIIARYEFALGKWVMHPSPVRQIAADVELYRRLHRRHLNQLQKSAGQRAVTTRDTARADAAPINKKMSSKGGILL